MNRRALIRGARLLRQRAAPPVSAPLNYDVERDEGVQAFITELRLRPHPAKGNKLANQHIAVKANICIRESFTSCASEMLADFTSPIDATAVELLKDQGAQIIGKTNCDEFGMGSHNINSYFGPVWNPYQAPSSTDRWEERERRSPGGSSGGSAAAVAAGFCSAALSTDTGGSTRLPASYCGIAGLKPSYGLISRHGVIPFADSLDCVGIMAKRASDIFDKFNVLSVYDPKDPTSASVELRQKARATFQHRLDSFEHCNKTGQFESLKGMTIGIPQEYFPEELDFASLQPFRRLLGQLRNYGATIVPVSLPSTNYALSAYYVISSAEASSNMARYSGIHYGKRVAPPDGSDNTKVANVYSHSRSEYLGHEVQKRILLGSYALTADAFNNYFLQAQRVRKLVQRDFNRVFLADNPLASRPLRSETGVDVLMHPSAVGTAPLFRNVFEMSELEAYVQDVLTVPASLAGLPALSVPAGLAEDGWPVGVSIVGQWGLDELVLRVAEFIERQDLVG